MKEITDNYEIIKFNSVSKGFNEIKCNNESRENLFSMMKLTEEKNYNKRIINDHRTFSG